MDSFCDKDKEDLSEQRSEFSRMVCPMQLDGAELSDIAYIAEATECAAVAERMGCQEIHHLAVHADLRPRKWGWQLNGVVQAELMRECVISLEPFVTTLSSDFEVQLRKTQPKVSPKATSQSSVSDDDAFDLDGEDVEYLSDGKFDLGELAVQYLSLALTDTPRHPDLAQDFGNQEFGQQEFGQQEVGQQEIGRQKFSGQESFSAISESEEETEPDRPLAQALRAARRDT